MRDGSPRQIATRSALCPCAGALIVLLLSTVAAEDPKAPSPADLLLEAAGEKAGAAPTDSLPCPLCGRSNRLQWHCGRCVGNGKLDCGSCLGKGKVPCTNPGCNRGKVHYEDAKLNPDTCKVCAGSGSIKCAPCAGAGAGKCAECKGSGAVTWKCPLCEGKKSIALPSAGSPCASCAGSSEVACVACNVTGKASIPCPRCGGPGWQACAQCRGAAKLPCPEKYCNGTGFHRAVWSDDRTSAQKKKCSTCKGGGTQACPKCKGGTETCSDCSGSGTRELSCLACFSRGKRPCPVCVQGALWGTTTDGGAYLFGARLSDVAPVLDARLRAALQAHSTTDTVSWIFCDWMLVIVDNRKGADPIKWTETTEILALGGAAVAPVVSREKVMAIEGLKAPIEADVAAWGGTTGLLQGGVVGAKSCRTFLLLVAAMSPKARSEVQGSGAAEAQSLPSADVAPEEALRIAYGGSSQGSETVLATLASGAMDARTRTLLLDTYWKEVFMRK